MYLIPALGRAHGPGILRLKFPEEHVLVAVLRGQKEMQGFGFFCAVTRFIMCEQGEWSGLCDTSPVGRQAALDWHGLVLLWGLDALHLSGKRRGKKRSPHSSCCLLASLPPRDTEHPQDKGGKILPPQMLQHWMQHKQSQEQQRLLQLSLQKLYSTLFIRLSSWERGAVRRVLLVPEGLEAPKCSLSPQVGQSIELLRQFCYSALFSPQRFLMVVLAASTGKEFFTSSLLPCVAVLATNTAVSSGAAPVVLYQPFPHSSRAQLKQRLGLGVENRLIFYYMSYSIDNAFSTYFLVSER